MQYIPILIISLVVHWVADFMLQTHEQATNKSKSIYFLSEHVLFYFTFLACYSVLFEVNIAFAFINAFSHFAIDFFTSKLTSKLWKEEKWHDFFVVIGFDQLLHVSILIATTIYYFN